MLMRRKKAHKQPTAWEMYKEKIRIPMVLLFADGTIILVVLSIITVVFLFLKGVEVAGPPAWFTDNVERVDLIAALIDITILAIDTTGKILAAAIKGFKNEPNV